MPSLLHTFRRYAASPLAVSVAALALANAASGQQDDVVFSNRIPHAKLIFTESDVYSVGASSILCEGRTEVIPDPRGRYALITQTDTNPYALLPSTLSFPPAPPENALERGVAASLIVYDSRTGRTKTIWQHRAHPYEVAEVRDVSWLKGKEAALVTVSVARWQPGEQPEKSAPVLESSLLEVHPEAASGTPARVLFRSSNSLATHVSPTLPIALLEETGEENSAEGKPSFAEHYRVINAAGLVGPVLPLGAQTLGGYKWDDIGNTTYLSETVRNTSTTATPPAASGATEGSAPRWKEQWYALDMKTEKLTPLEKHPLARRAAQITSKESPPLSVRLASDPIPATLAPPPAPPTVGGAPSTTPIVRSTTQVWPLWLQCRTSPIAREHRPSAALLAGDVDAATLLPDGSAVLYAADGALHAVPLTHQPRADVEGPYRRYLQQVTMSNAKQVGLAVLQYSQDYDELLPPTADFSKNVYPYVKNNDVFNNPETDQPAFQYLMDGNTLASIQSPATTVMGYLTGPDGRAALYADGHVKWEADPATDGK